MASNNQPGLSQSVFRYSAKVGGVNIRFGEVSGLTMEQGTRPLGTKSTSIKAPQNVTPITLKRGVIKDGLELYAWFSSPHISNPVKKEVIISLMDDENNEMMIWTITNAVCTKFESPSLNAKSNDVSFQAIDIMGDSIS